MPLACRCCLPRAIRLAALIIAISVSMLNASSLGGETDSDIWIVDTRHLGPPRSCRWACPPKVWRSVDGKCQLADLDQLISSHNPEVPTCIYIHGNRMQQTDAPGQGLAVHDRLTNRSCRCRFIIWSWPSERLPCGMRDVRVKAGRSDNESVYVANFLNLLPPESELTIVAYSYGARAATGSLHLLAGGAFRGCCLPDPSYPRIRPRVVLMAAAFPRGWLTPNGAHGLALTQTEQLVCFYNRRDPALKYYDVVFRNEGRPQPLGLQGIAARHLGPERTALCQFDVTQTVGHSHSLYRYMDSATIMRIVRANMFR